MMVEDEHPTSLHRNYTLAVLNQVFIRLGMSFTHPSMVLAVLVRQMGGSNTLVGLLPALRFGGWFLPQFLVGGAIQHLPRKLPFYVVMDSVRVVIYTFLGLLLFIMGASDPSLFLAIFFVLFTISRLTTGSSAVVRLDLIGKVIPATRRASFMAARGLYGGLAGFAAGFVVGYILDTQDFLGFPRHFALLFLIAAASFAASVLVFSRVYEPPMPGNPPRISVRQQLSRVPTLLQQDPNYRRYVVVRLLLNMVRIADPFYVIYALEVLHAPVAMVGTYLSTLTLASILSNPLWNRVSQRRGIKTTLLTSSFLTDLTPLLAVGMPFLPRSLGLGNNHPWSAYIFGLVFAAAGLSQSGRGISLMTILLNISPPEERPSYIGFVNTLLGIESFLPVFAGGVVDTIGFVPVFLAAAGFVLLGSSMALKLRSEPVAIGQEG